MNSLFPYKKLPLGAAALAAALLPCVMVPQTAEAAYESSDSTAGVNRLDYLENRHRREREERPTEAQVKTAMEAAEVAKNVRYPADPADPDTAAKPAPTSFEGDELTYDQVTGDFSAVGSVHIVQADGHAFDTDDSVIGNLLKQQVELPGYAHVVQVTPGETRVDLTGYEAFYRYGARTGSMTDAKGKVGHQYVTGKRFEFYPDHMIIHDGTETKCSAKHPDYQVAAKVIEYWPDKYTIYRDAKYLIKGNVVAQKKLHIVKAGEEPKDLDWLPRIGYDKDDGVWLREHLQRTIAPRVEASFTGKLMTKNDQGGRGHGDVTWTSPKAGSFQLTYGYFEDDDQNWIKRKPEFSWSYGHPIANTKWSYGLNYSIGRWNSQHTGIESTHTVYELGFWRQPVDFGGRWYFTPSLGYKITTESYDDSRVKGMWADMSLLHEFDDRWAAYVAYAYSKYNNQNALFDYDLDDYTQKWQAGASYRMTERDRFVAALEWDAQHGQMNDVDYYWFHDMHCAQLILRYRSKQSTWKVAAQFTPW